MSSVEYKRNSLGELYNIKKPLKQTASDHEHFIQALEDLSIPSNEQFVLKFISDIVNVKEKRNLMKQRNSKGYCSAFFAVTQGKLRVLIWRQYEDAEVVLQIWVWH